jgi:Cu-Zn family superoxide dismutase
MRFAMLSGLICGVVMVGCVVEEVSEPRMVATAAIEPRSGNGTLVGTAYLTDVAGQLSLTIEIDGAPPGKHGVHLHQTGDCSAPDATSAGPHWNPEGHMHGMPDAESHLGDLGNMIVREDGKGAITITKAGWSAGDGSDQDILGRAIIFHANVDDFTDPVGNAGGRIGCGVFELAPQ